MNKFKSYFKDLKDFFKLKNFVTYIGLIIFLGIFLILQGTMGLQPSTLDLLEEMGVYILGAMALSFVVGYLGELSLGHAAFMSIGAFVSVYFRQTVLTNLDMQIPFLSFVISLIVGGLVAAVAGFIIGLPALRLKGDYLAIVTLAFGEILKSVLKNVLSDTVGELECVNGRYDENSLYIIAFVLIILTLIMIKNIIKSKHGRAIMAVRDNEIAAKAMGVNVTYYKLAVFVISAFVAGVAGVLFGGMQYSVNPESFDYNKSIDLLVMVVLGGMGNITGTIISAAVITLLNNKLSIYLTGDLSTLKNLIYATVLIGIVIYNNAPALKNVRAKYNFKNLYFKIKKAFVRKKKKSRKKVRANMDEDLEHGADWSVVPTKIEMDAILSTDLTPDNNYTPDKPKEK